MFKSVESSVDKISVLIVEGFGPDSHLPEVQWPVFIMKNKLLHAFWSLPAGSIPMGKGTTLLSNKGYSLPVASKFSAHPGTPKCNRSRAICISLWAMGFRWTPFFDWKGQFFPPLYSWCSAFDPNTHTITNKLKTACVWIGWGLQETQKVILNTSCPNHSSQGEGDPKRRVPQCSLPKLRVDVTPRSKSNPGPSVTTCQEKREPQMTVTYIFIQHAKPVMMYTDDASTATSNIGCHHGPRAWEQLAGNEWWEARYARSLQAYEGHPIKRKI